MSNEQSFFGKLTSDYLPLFIMGMGVLMVAWVFFGDYILG